MCFKNGLLIEKWAEDNAWKFIWYVNLEGKKLLELILKSIKNYYRFIFSHTLFLTIEKLFEWTNSLGSYFDNKK